MELSTSEETASCAATQEFLTILWNPKVHYSPSHLTTPNRSVKLLLVFASTVMIEFFVLP
jgi:hypothetical protein